MRKTSKFIQTTGSYNITNTFHLLDIYGKSEHKIRKLYWERKKNINLSQHWEEKNRTNSCLCVFQQRHQRQQETRLARQQEKKKGGLGGGGRSVWTWSCIVILYSKLLWHSTLWKQVIHSKCEIKTIKGIACRSYWGCQYRLPTGVGRWCGEIRGKKELRCANGKVSRCSL